MTNIKSLKELGLNGKEAAIFMILLENGPANLKVIAEQLEIAETETKNILQVMADKEYITPIKNNNNYQFYANHTLLGMHF